MKTFLFSLIGLLICSYGATAQDTGYSFKESYAIAEPAQLTVSSEDSNIEVLPTDQKRMEVYYIVKKNNELLKTDRAELEKQVTLEFTSAANSLKISLKYPKSLRPSIVNNRITVGFKIYVPKQTACNLLTSDGNVSVSGLISDQRITTSDGNIRVFNIKGTVNGLTSDGNVSLEDVAGNATATTSDGNMKASKIKGDVYLKTSDGNIEFAEISGSLTALTSDGQIRGSMNDLKGKLFLTTSDGNIDVTVPDGLGLTLDMTGSSVRSSLKNFSGSSGKRSIQGQLNGGGIPVKLKTSDGNVNLSYK